MPPTYLTWPIFKVTCGATDATDKIYNIQVTRQENAFDTAQITYADPNSVLYTAIAPDVTTTIQIKDYIGGSWVTPYAGIIRFRKDSQGSQGEIGIATLDGTGFGLAETSCNQEYGVESANSTLDTIKKILTDSSYGIVPKYVNKILGSSTNSGYTYGTTNIDDISGSIPYLYFPFSPNSKNINNVCNLLQAIKGTNAGPHWIVTTDNKLHIKLVGDTTQSSWTKYYGGQTNSGQATITQGIDFLDGTFENVNTEANYILYHSTFVKPGSGDWAENNASSWTSTGTGTLTDESGVGLYTVGTKSIKFTPNNLFGSFCIYPSSINLALDLTKSGGRYNHPTLSFWLYNTTPDLNPTIRLRSLTTTLGGYFLLSNAPTTIASTWVQYTFEIGPYADNKNNVSWVPISVTSAPSWSQIDSIDFSIFANTGSLYIDGLCFSGWVIRGAKNSTSITAHGLRQRTINDPFGKSDSLKLTDDGTVAKLAYAELLRQQTTPLIGTFTIPILPDLLPGQLLHIRAKKKIDGSFTIDKDMRVTQIVHSISQNGFTSKVTVTDDLINSQTRAAYDDPATIAKAQRPEFQDRQATGIKMREIDITQSILEMDYPS